MQKSMVLDGWVDGWMGGWMDGWVVKPGKGFLTAIKKLDLQHCLNRPNKYCLVVSFGELLISKQNFETIQYLFP